MLNFAKIMLGLMIAAAFLFKDIITDIIFGVFLLAAGVLTGSFIIHLLKG